MGTRLIIIAVVATLASCKKPHTCTCQVMAQTQVGNSTYYNSYVETTSYKDVSKRKVECQNKTVTTPTSKLDYSSCVIK